MSLCGTPFGPVFPQGKHHHEEPALDGGDGDFAGFRVTGGDAFGDAAEVGGTADGGERWHIKGGTEMGIPHFGNAAAAVDARSGLRLPDVEPGETGEGAGAGGVPEGVRLGEDRDGRQEADAGDGFQLRDSLLEPASGVQQGPDGGFVAPEEALPAGEHFPVQGCRIRVFPDGKGFQVAADAGVATGDV